MTHMDSTFQSSSPAETKRIARRILSRIKEKNARTKKDAHVHILALEGDLGSGKTTFAQGIGNALGIRHLPSPTFTLMNTYSLNKTNRGHLAPWNTLVHIDCYRASSAHDFEDIGVHDMLADPRALVLIEWPEIVRPLLPHGAALFLAFSHGRKPSDRIIRTSFTQTSRVH